MIIQLSFEHFNECLKIHKSKTRVSGTVPLTEQEFISTFSPYFAALDKKVVFGYLENGKILSFVFASFMDTVALGSFWILSGYYSSIDRKFFSWANPEAGKLLKHIMTYAENNGYYVWYYTVSERIENVFEKKWKNNPYVQQNRHVSIKLDTIPPNTISENKLYWRLMGERLNTDTLIVKKRVLKEEFRKR